ncbi:MAG: sulfotransferase family 2 domain-containing protein [Planctomycetota bacterium]
MIVSHRHRFIFIKTEKTAGTSIEVHLSRHCGPEDIVTAFGSGEEGHEPRNSGGLSGHMTAAEVRGLVGERVFDSYFKFCVERNPWDRMVSMWYMVNARRPGLEVSFETFLTQWQVRRNERLYTLGDRVLVDEIVRYEDLPHALDRVLDRFGIPPFRGIRAKSQYRRERRPYQSYYSPAYARMVGKWFRGEARRMGYSFEPEGATGDEANTGQAA